MGKLAEIGSRVRDGADNYANNYNKIHGKMALKAAVGGGKVLWKGGRIATAATVALPFALGRNILRESLAQSGISEVFGGAGGVFKSIAGFNGRRGGRGSRGSASGSGGNAVAAISTIGSKIDITNRSIHNMHVSIVKSISFLAKTIEGTLTAAQRQNFADMEASREYRNGSGGGGADDDTREPKNNWLANLLRKGGNKLGINMAGGIEGFLRRSLLKGGLLAAAFDLMWNGKDGVIAKGALFLAKAIFGEGPVDSFLKTMNDLLGEENAKKFGNGIAMALGVGLALVTSPLLRKIAMLSVGLSALAIQLGYKAVRGAGRMAFSAYNRRFRPPPVFGPPAPPPPPAPAPTAARGALPPTVASQGLSAAERKNMRRASGTTQGRNADGTRNSTVTAKLNKWLDTPEARAVRALQASRAAANAAKAVPMLTRMGMGAMKVIPVVGQAATIGIESWDAYSRHEAASEAFKHGAINEQEMNEEKARAKVGLLARIGGGIAGMTAGGSLGATAGAIGGTFVAPGPGTFFGGLAGGLVGGVAGGIAGAWGAGGAAESVMDFAYGKNSPYVPTYTDGVRDDGVPILPRITPNAAGVVERSESSALTSSGAPVIVSAPSTTIVQGGGGGGGGGASRASVGSATVPAANGFEEQSIRQTSTIP